MRDVAPGTVLALDRGDWSLGTATAGGYPLFVRVERVRAELARYYDHRRVWLEGRQLARDGTPLSPVSLLVRVEALAKTIPDQGI